MEIAKKILKNSILKMLILCEARLNYNYVVLNIQFQFISTTRFFIGYQKRRAANLSWPIN